MSEDVLEDERVVTFMPIVRAALSGSGCMAAVLANGPLKPHAPFRSYISSNCITRLARQYFSMELEERRAYGMEKQEN